jgi:hypothetical protein
VTDSASQRRQWLVIVAASIAVSIQAYRVAIGEGGSLAVIASIAWLIVILISGWQLRQSPD